MQQQQRSRLDASEEVVRTSRMHKEQHVGAAAAPDTGLCVVIAARLPLLCPVWCLFLRERMVGMAARTCVAARPHFLVGCVSAPPVVVVVVLWRTRIHMCVRGCPAVLCWEALYPAHLSAKPCRTPSQAALVATQLLLVFLGAFLGAPWRQQLACAVRLRPTSRARARSSRAVCSMPCE
jgi:hypothetical protein